MEIKAITFLLFAVGGSSIIILFYFLSVFEAMVEFLQGELLLVHFHLGESKIVTKVGLLDVHTELSRTVWLCFLESNCGQ